MQRKLSSRERMLTALEIKTPDYVPCSFMIFSALAARCDNQFDFVQRQIEMGLDVKVELPELPIRFHPEVTTKEWKEEKEGEEYPLLHKEYFTPAGSLTSVVRKTEDWPYGDSVPLLNDYLAPRSQKFLVEKREDLESLRFLFAEPTREDIANFRNEARSLKRPAKANDLVVSGGWRSYAPEKGIDANGGTMGADALMWLCGGEKALLLAMDQPGLIEELLEMISSWNMKRISVYLEEGIDLLTRRAWYESTDLWSPALYRKFLLPTLQKEIEVTHQAGAKFGYIMTSGIMPLLDDFLKLGIDVLIGLDPLQGKGTDLKRIKKKLKGEICLWGGLNGFLSIERGSKEEVKEATWEAINTLAPEGGFIFSPVDNVTDGSEQTWENVKTMIKSWQEMRSY